MCDTKMDSLRWSGPGESGYAAGSRSRLQRRGSDGWWVRGVSRSVLRPQVLRTPYSSVSSISGSSLASFSMTTMSLKREACLRKASSKLWWGQKVPGRGAGLLTTRALRVQTTTAGGLPAVFFVDAELHGQIVVLQHARRAELRR